ncbi:hypothetical protein V2W45_1256389, partial [Cenococcum geophilum]
SRAYDIWSIGCIILEFITWLLEGSAAIEYFAGVRGKIRSGGINDGNYFTITLNGKSVIIRQDFIDWVDRLHCLKRCSAVIQLLLDFIINRLIGANPEDRIRAEDLYSRLRAIYEQAEGDEKYLLVTTPYPML